MELEFNNKLYWQLLSITINLLLLLTSISSIIIYIGGTDVYKKEYVFV
jgi:hypothetical protein